MNTVVGQSLDFCVVFVLKKKPCVFSARLALLFLSFFVISPKVR